MKLLGKVIGIVGLSFILFGCANTAYQSGRVDQRLEGNGTITKEDLREIKKLQDQRKANQNAWDTFGVLIDAILVIDAFK